VVKKFSSKLGCTFVGIGFRIVCLGSLLLLVFVGFECFPGFSLVGRIFLARLLRLVRILASIGAWLL
jgi:hypothetical protein